jgi:hypothetical protein
MLLVTGVTFRSHLNVSASGFDRLTNAVVVNYEGMRRYLIEKEEYKDRLGGDSQRPIWGSLGAWSFTNTSIRVASAGTSSAT